ncbi:hypothetical protein AN963_21750 [Brevibacillus choshinensis]|uniref:Uncharacterized protein n=1 Tax=Brevibacillus choshinensis TaxID=54911 RepID=A0ABR5N0M4_BRECH|nr:hypothetical protein [Brevibacillus choshinensis]KQL44058.1 hypothetical protein AN963_21750 [Brevibacillus choshinensis]MED4784615.1 hypothetical protein [Brevibacillus choshinensis]
MNVTDEQMAILEKFGFRIEGEQVKHFKMGIVREKEEFARISSREELQEYVKQLLRNQCLWKRQN